MPEKAYIGLTDDHCWALFYGDGTEDEPYLLAVGRPFKTGSAIRQAIDELEGWARENGYALHTPRYSAMHPRLEEVIEPEVFDEVFRPGNADSGL